MFQPLIVIVPETKSDPNTAKKNPSGFWPVIGGTHNMTVLDVNLQSVSTDQQKITIWDHEAQQSRELDVPGQMKVVHIKGAGGDPDGIWDKYAKKTGQ